MRLTDCHNIEDFRRLAKQRLPWPVFDYIDGAADDELTKARNTAAFADCDLVPDVLAGVEEIDTSVTIMGRKKRAAADPLAHRAAARVPLAGRARRCPRGGKVRPVVRHFQPGDGQHRGSRRRWSPRPRCSSSMSTRTRAQPLDDRALPGGEVRRHCADGRHHRRRQARTLRAQRLHLAAALHAQLAAVLCDQAALGAELCVPREIRPAPA